MNQAKIGVQAMMLKGKFDELGAYETLKKVSELGFRCIELSQIEMSAENVSEIKRACEDFNIEIAAVSAGLEPSGKMPQETLTTHFDKIVEDCKTLGCNFIRIGMLPFQCMGSTEKVLEFCDKANEVAKKLAEHHIKLYYHNHHVEFQKYDGKYLLDIMKEKADQIGFELDVHWIQRGGLNPIDVIRAYSGKVDLLHLKDYRIGSLPESAFEALGKGDFMNFMNAFTNIVEFAEVGEGSLDMKGIIEEGLACGVKYLLIEQDNQYGKDPFDCLALSAQNLRKLGYEGLF